MSLTPQIATQVIASIESGYFLDEFAETEGAKLRAARWLADNRPQLWAEYLEDDPDAARLVATPKSTKPKPVTKKLSTLTDAAFARRQRAKEALKQRKLGPAGMKRLKQYFKCNPTCITIQDAKQRYLLRNRGASDDEIGIKQGVSASAITAWFERHANYNWPTSWDEDNS